MIGKGIRPIPYGFFVRQVMATDSERGCKVHRVHDSRKKREKLKYLTFSWIERIKKNNFGKYFNT